MPMTNTSGTSVGSDSVRGSVAHVVTPRLRRMTYTESHSRMSAATNMTTMKMVPTGRKCSSPSALGSCDDAGVSDTGPLPIATGRCSGVKFTVPNQGRDLRPCLVAASLPKLRTVLATDRPCRHHRSKRVLLAVLVGVLLTFFATGGFGSGAAGSAGSIRRPSEEHDTDSGEPVRPNRLQKNSPPTSCCARAPRPTARSAPPAISPAVSGSSGSSRR